MNRKGGKRVEVGQKIEEYKGVTVWLSNKDHIELAGRTAYRVNANQYYAVLWKRLTHMEHALRAEERQLIMSSTLTMLRHIIDNTPHDAMRLP